MQRSMTGRTRTPYAGAEGIRTELGASDGIARRRLALGAFAGIMSGLLLIGCASSGIKLLVVNKAGAPLENVKVSYTGGSLTIKQLRVGGSYRKTIRPTAATTVDVEFKPPGGERKTEKVKADIQPGYAGDLRLELMPTGQVGWEKHLNATRSRAPKGKLVMPSNE